MILGKFQEKLFQRVYDPTLARIFFLLCAFRLYINPQEPNIRGGLLIRNISHSLSEMTYE
jgi:hypothetical protein